MAAFSLLLTVRHGDGSVRIEVRLARPLPWSEVRAVVCQTAGIDEGAVLYLGVGPVEDSWIVGAPPLLTGCLLATTPDDELRSHPPLVLAVVAGPDAGCAAPIGTAVIVVGRSDRADLTLTDAASSWRHVSITPAPTGLSVADLGSTNGVFVDGRRVDVSTIATTGSVIRIGNSVLQIQLTTEPAGAFRADGQGHVVRVGRPASPAEREHELPARPAEPGAPQRRSLPLLSALIGAAVGGVLAAVLHNPMYLAFAAFGPMTMIGSALTDRARGRRSHRRQWRDYQLSLAAWQRVAAAAASADRRSAWRRWPGPAQLLRRAEVGSARLWAKPAAGGIRVAIGCGTHPTGDQANSNPGPAPPIRPRAADAPVTTVLDGAIGFVGPVGRGVARYLIAQAACHYSPADVALVVVSDREDLACCRDLPHAVASTTPTATVDRAVVAAAGRRILVILDGPEALHSPLGASALSAATASADRSLAAVLCLAETPGMLPPQAVDIEAAAATCDAAGPLTVTGTSASLLGRLCRALAPLRDRVDTDAAALPGSVDLVDLTGPINADMLRRTWGAAPSPAVVGYGPAGEVGIDLDRDGPHLLIAGTTGSGKSELLQTLITSLAVGASPQSVTFLLVDYKGGSAFGTIAKLPHVVGVVTDLDPAGSARALTSMRAELRRRERLESAGEAPAAKLVVVIDEFATLAAELPEFLTGVLDIAQRGRSLGLHLVLATQRPAGVVSPAMRANISARICLRVTDPAESVDVIGVPDAAALPVGRPGRAISRLGGLMTMFQTALVSVPTPAEVSATAMDRQPPADQNGSGSGAGSILHAVIDAARAAAADIPPPDRPWLPPLPTRITHTDTAPGVLAVADVPDEQRRRMLAAPQASALVLGPPGSGRSTALRRIAAIAARADHELVVIDGSDALADLACWAQVSTYLTLREPRLVSRALALLGDPARRPRDGHLRHVVIGHLDLVLAELERTDYTIGSMVLTELLGRSAGSVRISAGGPEMLRHQRAAAAFTDIIELEGGTLPGRGLWSEREVQVVLEPTDTAPAAGTIAGTTAGTTRDGSPPTGASASRSVVATRADRPDSIVVRPLPLLASLDSLPVPEPARIPFAIGGDAALPLALDLTGPGGGIIVAGPRRSGVSTTLRVIARQAAAAGVRVVAVSAEPSAQPDEGVTVISCCAGTADLTALLHAHEGPLLLVADHQGLGADHPAAAVFDTFLSVCGAGQYLLVGARTDAVARSRRDHLRAAASYRQGLLLSPDQGDGAVLDLSLPRRAGPVVPGRGVWVWGGISSAVQVACGAGPAV